MNWDDDINGHWTRMKGKIKARWCRLTDNDLAVISGQRTQMAGLLRKRYGFEHDQAEREIERFVHNLN